MRVELIESPEGLEPHRESWDRLAVELGAPYCAPTWSLSWWRHAAPPSARLRTVVAYEGDELVGIAPLLVDGWGPGLHRYSFLAADASIRVEPLVRPESQTAVAEALAEALHASRPRLDLLSFRFVREDSPWPQLIAAAWPARQRPRIHHGPSLPSPTVRLDFDDLDAWLSTTSRSTRQLIRRRRRRFEEDGGSFAVSDADGVEAAFDEFLELHYANWGQRGGSWLAQRGLEAAMRSTALELAKLGRFRVASVRIDGRSVGAAVVISAGEEASFWLGGFDERWSKHSPGVVALVAAIEDGIARSETRLDLGPGTQDYKRRLSDRADLLRESNVMPLSPRYPMTRARLTARSLVLWARARRRS